ncbi:MAG: amidohydrolase family protein [Betaproteobacteria bacterium]|nr:MAG: amidohydrolase family protein [Betaproteobacteria bacterium]
MLDLRIDNATIYDGSGADPQAGSVGVKDGRICELGEFAGEAQTRIDARGLALMPGIIDTHTHYDAQITWDPYANPSPALGVTTVVMGNCGFTIAPCRPPDRDLTMRNLTHVEGMSLDALRSGIDWGFESFPAYLDMLERKGVGPNVACYVGHSGVRTFVLSDDASKRAADADEVKRMRNIVAEAMEAGACGFATTRSYQHNGEAGIPMPSRLADEHEMMTLSGALRDGGKGVLMMTKGSHVPMSWIESLSAAADRPYLVAALLHSNMAPELAFNDLADIAAAQTRGRRMYGAVSACPLTFEFTFHEPYPLEGFRCWKPLMQMDDAAFRAALADPKLRTAVREELQERSLRVFNGEWDKLFVAQAADAAHADYEGRSVADLAAASGSDPLDFMFDLAQSEDLDTLFTATLLNSDEEAVGKLLRDDNAIISLSDAGAHLTFLCDAGFGLHVLGHWVREQRQLSLSEAVRKLTSEPARLFGIRHRGRVEKNAWADLLLFDPDTVGRGATTRVYDLPAGASRLTTPAMGVHGVWVNGALVADGDGIRAGAACAGQVLRDFDT